MIDVKKWEEADPGTKYDYTVTTLALEDERLLTRQDLILMCKFLLDVSKHLKKSNKELIYRLEEQGRAEE